MPHALTRTSPKGGPFIGTCMNCGVTDIPIEDIRKRCKNTLGRSRDDTLLAAITGDPA